MSSLHAAISQQFPDFPYPHYVAKVWGSLRRVEAKALAISLAQGGDEYAAVYQFIANLISA